MSKYTIALIIIVLFGGGAILLAKQDAPARSTLPTGNNVSLVNGQQIVVLNAKGGYLPRVSVAKGGVATTLRVTTNATYDCSAVITIPALKHRSFLPTTGNTDIAIPAQAAGSVLKGTCGMGMYNFEIKFE